MSNSFKKIPEKTLRKKLLIIGALLDILKTEDKYVNKEKKSWLTLEKILTYMISMILIYINQLTSGITNVLSWLHANFLILNLEKTKIMLVGTHQRTAEADDLVIEISNTRLERVNKFKYLGVLLDNTLSWKDHVEYIGNKISSRLGILRRARKVLPKPTCQMLYNTLVLPLFDYCSPVWDSCGVGSKAYLDKLNRRAACIIEGRSIGAEELK